MADDLQTAIDYLNNSVKFNHKNFDFNMLYKVSW